MLTMTPQGADGYVDFRPALWALTGVRAGDSKAILVQVNSGGAPANLTGMTITAQARQTAVDPDPPALTGLITPDNLLQGRFFLRWDPDEVRSVLGPDGFWRGVWDCQLDVTTIVAGPITCESDVTR
jgi:hypothetical protein